MPVVNGNQPRLDADLFPVPRDGLGKRPAFGQSRQLEGVHVQREAARVAGVAQQLFRAGRVEGVLRVRGHLETDVAEGPREPERDHGGIGLAGEDRLRNFRCGRSRGSTSRARACPSSVLRPRAGSTTSVILPRRGERGSGSLRARLHSRARDSGRSDRPRRDGVGDVGEPARDPRGSYRFPCVVVTPV